MPRISVQETSKCDDERQSSRDGGDEPYPEPGAEAPLPAEGEGGVSDQCRRTP